jgi:hypothetical protein
MRALVIAVAIAALVAGAVTVANAARDPGPSSYAQSLRAEVQTPTGAPRPGSDPAAQRQTSLAEAAREHHGIGTWNSAPARDVKGGTARRDPGDVLGDPKRTGLLSSGCALGYGAPGAQCVPARGPGDKPMSCAYLVKLFPDGVPVEGRDTLKLDRNHDGRACGPGDA